MFTEENIVLQFGAKNKEQVLAKISELAFELNITSNQNELLKALRLREEETCTGMVNGIAIPHARSSRVVKPSIIFLKLTNSVAWESLDNEPVDLVFGLLAPDQNAELTHLQMLSNIATGLMDIENVKRIREAKTEGEIFAEINKFINKEEQ